MAKGRHSKSSNNVKRKPSVKTDRRRNKKLNNLLLLIFIIIFISSSGVMIYWLKSNYELSKIEEEVIDKVATINEDTNDPSKGSISVDFNSLKQINSDVKAWIYIKDTDINYPILQATDNDYYLKRDIYKRYSSAGSIFLDYNNEADFSDSNTVIYGHNLKNKKMFADLTKIYNGQLGNAINIEIYKEDGTFEVYEVVSVYQGVPDTKMIKKTFKSDEERINYINECIAKSSVKFEYNENTNFEDLLTLMTCDSSGYNRIVVNAQKKDIKSFLIS